ncbi:MAG: protein tyrosine phosphatase [Alphaproteobacteria bacterium]|nr:MAG: protein tyrosine phosphatase [Alphaproteobacteria bacterium]
MLRFGRSAEARQARRLRDVRLWSQPPATRRARLRAWSNMLLADHGIFRLVYPNYHWLSPRAARAAQPSPGLIRRFAREGGRSVLSLRGGLMFGSLPLEIEACEEAGLVFSRVQVRSRQLPSPEEFRAILAAMRAAEPPVLYHCKSGADRAGFVSVLHMHLIEGAPLEVAMRQLSLRYGHMRQARTGILDHFFETYRDTARPGQSLEDWVEDGYDPARIAASFHESRGWSWLVDKVLRRE